MAYFGSGHKGEYTVYHTEAGSQNGHYRQIFGYHLGSRFCHGRLHFYGDGFNVPEGFVSHEHGDFFHQLAEFFGTCFHVAHNGDFVCDKGMIEYCDFTHSTPLFRAVFIIVSFQDL